MWCDMWRDMWRDVICGVIDKSGVIKWRVTVRNGVYLFALQFRLFLSRPSQQLTMTFCAYVEMGKRGPASLIQKKHKYPPNQIHPSQCLHNCIAGCEPLIRLLQDQPLITVSCGDVYMIFYYNYNNITILIHIKQRSTQCTQS